MSDSRKTSRRGASPAIIVAALALVAALAGTAIAGPDAQTSALSKKKVKKIAKKEIKKAAPTLSVQSAETADTATTAETAGSADNVLWAVVSNGAGAADAAVARSGEPGYTVREAAGPSAIVDFQQTVTQCAWIATKGSVANAAASAQAATTEGVAANPQEIQVRVRNAGGVQIQDAFHLSVIC